MTSITAQRDLLADSARGVWELVGLLRRGAWAIADQALFSLSTFAVTVLLARWLSAEGYGAFAVAFAIYLLISTFHTAVVVEPMLIFGSGRFASSFAGYLATVVRVHFVLTGILAAVLLGAGLVMQSLGQRETGTVLATLAFVMPLMLLAWLLRRACYIEGNVRTAAYASAVNLGSTALGLFGLSSTHRLSASTALIVMGVAGLISAGVILRRLASSSLSESPTFRDVIRIHWSYGRWASAATAMNWIPSNAFFVVLPSVAGLAASATYRALLNLVQPPIQLQQAIANVMLPILVRERDSNRYGASVRTTRALLVVSAIVYAIPVAIFSGPIMDALYGGRYTASHRLLLPLVLLPVIAGVIASLVISLQSLEQPRRIFAAWSWTAALTATIGSLAVIRWGLAGAVVGMVAIYLLAAVFFVRESSRARRLESNIASSRN